MPGDRGWHCSPIICLRKRQSAQTGSPLAVKRRCLSTALAWLTSIATGRWNESKVLLVVKTIET